jgi:hypothetical protein
MLIRYGNLMDTMFPLTETNLPEIVGFLAKIILQLIGWLFNDAVDIETIQCGMIR